MESHLRCPTSARGDLAPVIMNLHQRAAIVLCCSVVQQCAIMKAMNTEEFRARARIMKALSSPVRLMIVDQLSRGERCMCELQPLFPMNKSTLSRHVAALKNVGIVSERREGVRCFLKLETPCILNIFDCAMGVIRAEAKRQAKLVKG